MKKEQVYELRNLANELNLPNQLFRVVVANSMVLTGAYKDQTKEDEAFEVSVKALNKANPDAFIRSGKLDYNVYLYGKQLVQDTIQEEKQVHR